MNQILFERLGGTAGITAIVDDVVDAHMNNPSISATIFTLPRNSRKN